MEGGFIKKNSPPLLPIQRSLLQFIGVSTISLVQVPVIVDCQAHTIGVLNVERLYPIVCFDLHHSSSFKTSSRLNSSSALSSTSWPSHSDTLRTWKDDPFFNFPGTTRPLDTPAKNLRNPASSNDPVWCATRALGTNV